MKKGLKGLIAILLSAMMVFTMMPTINADSSTTISIDLDRRYQEMEGFGFFGGTGVWWSSQERLEKDLDKWSDHIINDLGLTMWRNELYPHIPVDQNVAPNQDASWPKQKKTVQSLKAAADKAGVDLKVILTVWSPPAEFKVATDPQSNLNNQTAIRGGEHIYGCKKGGTMNPEKYTDYANWFIDALDMYKEIGVDVYAISLQNEPAFAQEFNSCIYTAAWYAEMIVNVIPIIKEKYPNVKIYGTEEMLTDAIESKSLMTEFNYNPKARDLVDVYAVHGYSDGVRAEAVENHKELWERLYNDFAKEPGKPTWMTETSGYTFDWLSNGSMPGALDLGIAINSAIKYGKASAWVWWQGTSHGGANEFTLLNDQGAGKKYEVSRHFYKFVRPGTVMVDAKASNEKVIATSFHDVSKNTFTSVIINDSDEAQTITLEGQDIQDTYTMYLTTSDANVNLQKTENVKNGEIVAPAHSIITLVNENTVHTPLEFLPNPAIKKSIESDTTKVTGTHGVDGAYITVYNNGKKLGQSTVKNGSFSVKIKGQKPGSKLTIEATKEGYRESSISKTVKYQAPVVKKVKAKAKFVTGKTYKKSKVTVLYAGKKIGSATANAKGEFKVKLKKTVKKGKKLVVKTVCAGKTKKKTIKVK